MSVNYVYWDIDTTNWNNVYLKYKPIFSKLDLNNNTDVKNSVSYFKEMSNTLLDGHYHISFKKYAIIDSFVYPSYNKKKDLVSFHNPYPFYGIDTNYLDAHFQFGLDNNYSFGGQPLVVICGTINKKILYFSCNYFALAKAYYATAANKIQPVLNSFFSTLNDLPPDIKGLIIDVRSNYGGDLVDLDFLIGRLTIKPLLFGYTQYKVGNGRFDNSAWIESYINPQTNSKAIGIPIVVLADNTSASLAESVVMAIKVIPNSIVVGETTYGATGPIISDNNLYNSGSFVVQNFMDVQTSSAKFKYVDNKIYEGKGFPPDIYVPFNLISLQNKTDLQLEKAIKLF
jgi:hypothetical protein